MFNEISRAFEHSLSICLVGAAAVAIIGYTDLKSKSHDKCHNSIIDFLAVFCEILRVLNWALVIIFLLLANDLCRVYLIYITIQLCKLHT